MWSAIATWPFSLQAVSVAGAILQAGGHALDAAEAGIRTVEEDPSVDSVGLGGFLNEKGELELDAALMDGNRLSTGAVMGVQHFLHPVSIARAVMDHTRHNILVGRAAEEFARSRGIPETPIEELIPESVIACWKKCLAEKKQTGHDTIGLITLDQTACLSVGTSTSGASLKTPGRVGDSPLIGSGFYADSTLGAAAATGLGEDIMRTCMSYRCVALMQNGLSPMEAARETVVSAVESLRLHGRKADQMALVCMNPQGEWGAAANHEGFCCCVARDGGAPECIPICAAQNMSRS